MSTDVELFCGIQVKEQSGGVESCLDSPAGNDET